jgi:hypothetical protein
MRKMKKPAEPLSEMYREESPKPAVVITVVIVALIAAPLALANKRIGDDGQQAADVSKYSLLARQLNANVTVVLDALKRGVVKESTLKDSGVLGQKGPTTIIPPVTPTNLNESSGNPNELEINLTAIYWNPRDPLVTIDNENYYVGDKVKGFTILEIRKTEVVFRSPAGEKIVKYFYDYLN